MSHTADIYADEALKPMIAGSEWFLNGFRDGEIQKKEDRT